MASTNQISNLQLYKGKFMEGMNEQNNLVTALMTRPEDVTGALAWVCGYYYEKYPLGYLTQGMGRTKIIGNDEYEWSLMGEIDKPITVMSLVTGGSTPGINHTTFKVMVEGPKWFDIGDVIVGLSGQDYQMRVQDNPDQDGNNYILTLQLISPDPTKYLPAESYASGAEFTRWTTAFEEYSRGGHATKASPFKLRNQLTTHRKSDIYTGSVVTDVMYMKLTDPTTGKASLLWADWAQWQFMLQWYEEVEMAKWYGIYNRDAQGIVHLPGGNGRPVLTGAGVLQQIAPANRRTYTTLTEDIILEFLTDLSMNSRDVDSRKFMAFTGWEGMRQFHNALKNSAAAYTLVDTKFVFGNGQELGLGGQFVTYRGLNGVELTLKHCPMYDNPTKHLKLHPQTLKPLESYRFTILDFGMYGGESNIQLFAKGANGIDRSMMSWYTAGSTTPTGGAGGDAMSYKNYMRSSDIDGYSIHFLSQQGVMVKNPMACGELICDAA